MEQPNMKYINALSDGDLGFKNKIINIIKLELPDETLLYNKNMADKNYKKAAENVHKLKHKISILGLEKSCVLATEFENNLKDGNPQLEHRFNTILQTLAEYLKTL